MMRRLLPHPLLSAMLLVIWLLLANDVGFGHILLGGALGVFIPLFSNRFWPERPRLARPGTILLLSGRLLRDIAAANFTVASAILHPPRNLTPGFVHYPLELRNEFAITVFASMISLTPGTVSADLNADHTVLLIHALNVTDRDALIAEIKRRYEQPLQEIFPC
jgi:multicomponent K+:H+ antiporter subunit E